MSFIEKSTRRRERRARELGSSGLDGLIRGTSKIKDTHEGEGV